MVTTSSQRSFSLWQTKTNSEHHNWIQCLDYQVVRPQPSGYICITVTESAWGISLKGKWKDCKRQTSNSSAIRPSPLEMVCKYDHGNDNINRYDDVEGGNPIDREHKLLLRKN